MDLTSLLASTPFMIIVGVAILIGLASLLRRSAPPIPVVQKPVLTRAEIAFHRTLSQAVSGIGGLTIQSQMAMSAFLQPRPGLDRGEHLSTFRRFSQKRPDFVLVDQDWRVRLIVELDDSTHDASKDAERDRLTAAAGIRTLRFRNVRGLDAGTLRARILEALNA